MSTLFDRFQQQLNWLKDELRCIRETVLTPHPTHVSTFINDGEDGLNPYISFADVYTGNAIIFGGVIWLGTGLDYYIWTTKYIIDNVIYDGFVSGTVTLSDADSINSRIDSFIINSDTKASGTVTLTAGASGSVDTLSANAINLLTAVIPFNTDLATTATDVVNNINANFIVNKFYNASNIGAIITITSKESGVIPNTYVILSTATTITTTDVNMSGGVDAIPGDVTNSTVGVITGVPDPSPDEPNVELSTQAKVSFKIVAAGEVAPPVTTNVQIYDENAGTPTEWDGTSQNLAVDFAYATNPGKNSVSILFPTVVGKPNPESKATLTSGTVIPYDNDNTLNFLMRTDGAFPSLSGGNQTRFKVRVIENGGITTTINYNASGLVGVGFDHTILDTWQQVSISFVNFAQTQIAQIDAIEFIVENTDPILIQVDDVYVQLASPAPPVGVPQIQSDWNQTSTTPADYIKNKPTALSDFIDDIGVTDPLVPNTIFVDTISGDDGTGALQNRNQPFLTLGAAFLAVPSTGWDINFIDGNVTRVLDGTYPQAFSPSISSSSIGTFDFTAITPLIADLDLKIDIPNARLLVNRLSNLPALGSAFDVLNSNKLEVKASTIEITGLIGTDQDVFTADNNANTIETDNLITNYTQTTGALLNGEGSLKVLDTWTNTTLGKIYTGASGELDVEVNILTLSGDLSIFNVEAFRSFKLKTLNGTNELTLFTAVNDTSIPVFTADDLVIGGTASMRVLSGINLTQTKLTGTILNAITFSTGLDEAADLILEGFTGTFLSDTNARMFSRSVTIIDSRITYTTYFLTNTVPTALGSIRFEGFNIMISSDNSTYMFTNMLSGNIVINGSVKTNNDSFGEELTSSRESFTFKEKSLEIVVRDKADLINRDLSSLITYIIDGVITLTAGEYIEVPQAGLTIKGYGFEPSKIEKEVAESIFIDNLGTGNSGSVFLGELSIESNQLADVFDLTDATGFNAVELNEVNFNNLNSLGELTNYRQGLWNNIGIFGCDDGLTFSGTWLGGFRASLTIVRTFTTGGTLFKEGTALVFNGRFLTDVNFDLPVGAEFSNFVAGNFGADELFQLEGVLGTRAGAIDVTQNYTGTLKADSDVSKWKNNTGILNTEGRVTNDVTTSRTFVLTDISDTVTLNNVAAISALIPTNAVTPFPLNTKLELANIGSGTATIGGAGVTILGDASLLIMEQDVKRTLIKLATDTWLVEGGGAGGGTTLPPVENEYATMAAMYADQVSQTSGFIQYVVDASGHPDFGAVSWYFEYLGTTVGDDTDYRALTQQEVDGLQLQADWNQTLTSSPDYIKNKPDVGERKRAVIDYVDNTLVPPTEVSGDRYILDFTGASHANWDGAVSGDIVQFNGTTWDAETPIEGWVAYVDLLNEDYRYIDDGSPVWEATAIYVPYTGATADVNLNTRALSNVSLFNGIKVAGDSTRVHVGANTVLGMGTHSNALGAFALGSGTGSDNNAIGYFALRNSSGNDSNAIGESAGRYNTGTGLNVIGHSAGSTNVGIQANGMGTGAIGSNQGSQVQGIGQNACGNNRGNFVAGIGQQVAERNLGNTFVALGDFAGHTNIGDDNVAIGSNSFGFIEDTASNIVADSSTDINNTLEQITETGHGYTIGAFIHLKNTATTGSFPSGLLLNQIHIWEIIDANTLQCITDSFTDNGTGLQTFTPQFIYNNSTSLGANSLPTQSNQVMLGDANITSVRTANASYIATHDQDFVTKKGIEDGNIVWIPLGYACSDEISDLEVQDEALRFRMPFAMTLLDIIITANVGPTGSKIICDLTKDGTTMLSTLVSIDEETKATGTVDLTAGTDGDVSGITVDGVEIMSGAETWITSLGTTATNVAANITAFTSVPNYNAVAVGTLITITAEIGGASYNGFVVVSTTTLTLTSTDVNMASGATEETSNIASVPVVISDSALAINTEISLNIDQVGSTNTGKGLKAWLIGIKA